MPGATYYEGIDYSMFVMKELLPGIESHYRVQTSRSERAIGGLSLGGYWALKIAFLHPDLFDFLGFGFSDKPRPHDYSLFEQADIAQAVAAHFGLKRTFILTHDMGNSVALEILKRGDPVVDKLVMLNGSMLLKYYRSLLSQKLLLHPIFGPVISALRLIRRPVFARQFRSLFATQPSELEIDTFWSLIRYNDGLGIYHRLIKYLNERKIHEHTWLDVLEAHHTALTIIWGQHDSVSVSRIGEYLVELRPDATYYPLAATGHYPQWEAPERLAEILRTALG